MKSERSLINFDPKKEKIKSQLFAIQPMRTLYGETRLVTLADDIEARKRDAFEQQGFKGVVEEYEDALLYASTMAKLNYSITHGYMNDLCIGIYTMLTQGQGLYDFHEIFDDEGNAIAARVILSKQTLFKALFGLLVDDNGRALAGCGDIVHDGKKYIMPIITGKKPSPEAYGSIHKINSVGDPVKAVIHGKPLDVNKRITGTIASDAIMLDLDYFFFPVKIENKKFIANEKYIHQVAGLTSFIKLGSKITRQKQQKNKFINATTARKIIMSAQAGYELRYFVPGIVKEQRGNRVNIVFKRESVRDLYPMAYDAKTEWIRYNEFINAVNMAGEYFHAAMIETGLKERILKSDDAARRRGKKEDELVSRKLLCPARNKGAEFPLNKNKVYIKADVIE